jgi:hypothetical protein
MFHALLLQYLAPQTLTKFMSITEQIRQQEFVHDEKSSRFWMWVHAENMRRAQELEQQSRYDAVHCQHIQDGQRSAGQLPELTTYTILITVAGRAH